MNANMDGANSYNVSFLDTFSNKLQFCFHARIL